ncbi:DUF4433 domain-containing protein [Halomonas aquamarina]|uniref:DUF4433 domain-containing protein n=1 Tax=Vreelandella aquamarina TaxID=77097 RepID=A0ACC5VSY6_9GAMM|nr:DarT ssDNA thymidine ADP-ribosyltransferase family protein [Halomonas aquamarina]MBZ5487252.1 DUF4433 domain-containing protein [Halomonas aquamarina]
MNIKEIINNRGIAEILHFTTNKGALGILDGRCVKSRKRLNTDERLEHVFKPNAGNRDKDLAWLDYVNLSVSKINLSFFSICSEKWHVHEDYWWCIFAFSPHILEHPGVYFTTTNNIYTSVKRCTGEDGLRNMFCDSITRWSGNVVRRSAQLDESFTTCEQAEILYPKKLSTEYLTKIYVAGESHADELFAQIRAVNHVDVEIEVAPSMFRQH